MFRSTIHVFPISISQLQCWTFVGEESLPELEDFETSSSEPVLFLPSCLMFQSFEGEIVSKAPLLNALIMIKLRGVFSMAILPGSVTVINFTCSRREGVTKCGWHRWIWSGPWWVPGRWLPWDEGVVGVSDSSGGSPPVTSYYYYRSGAEHRSPAPFFL